MEPKPRHLNDETAMLPAVPSAPKHSAEDPDRRGTPYLDSVNWPHPPIPPVPPVMAQPDGVAPPPAAVRRVTAKPQRVSWWRKLLGV